MLIEWMLIEGYFSSPTLSEIIYTFPLFCFYFLGILASLQVRATCFSLPILNSSRCLISFSSLWPQRKNIYFLMSKSLQANVSTFLFSGLFLSQLYPLINSNFYYNEFFYVFANLPISKFNSWFKWLENKVPRETWRKEKKAETLQTLRFSLHYCEFLEDKCYVFITSGPTACQTYNVLNKCLLSEYQLSVCI